MAAVILLATLCFLPPGTPTRSTASPTWGADSLSARVGAPHPATAAADPAGVWSNLTGAVGSPPSVLAPAGMAYDVADGYAVAFGGTSSGPYATPTSATWAFVGHRWQNLTPGLTQSPPARREGATFAYDPSLSGIVLFGGLGTQGYLGDTWLFHHGQWSDLSSSQSHAPSARDAAVAAYDPGSTSLILFGGVDASGPRTDTYALSGGVWSVVATSATTPPSGCCGAMVYDPTDGYLVAAISAGGVGPTQTWTYASGAWTNRTGAVAPSPRLGASLEFDRLLGVVLLFGGTDPQTTGALNDSWTFSAGTWSVAQSSVSAAPSPRWSAGFSDSGNNSSSDCLVLFGGFDARGGASPERGQTWALCGRSTSLVSGPGAGGGALGVQMSISRSIGVVPFEVTVVTRAAGGAGPYNLSVCPGTGRCEQALAWDGSTYSSTQLFTSPGTFTVSSVVTDEAGTSRAATATVEALALVPLEAPYTFSPLNGSAPLTVTFEVSVRGGYAPYAIQWNFGDGENGSSLSGGAITHTYTSTGTFTPTLSIRDLAGQPLNRTLPSVHVGGAIGAGSVGLGALVVPAAWVGASVLVALLAVSGVRRRRRRVEAEARELVDGLWQGRAGPPEKDP